MAVRWVKCLAPFQTLSLKDQVDLYFLSERKQIIVLGFIFKGYYQINFIYFTQLLLLQESWKDLFILHLSQWAIPWDLSDLLMNRQTQLRKEGNILQSEDEIIDMEIKSMQVSTFVHKCMIPRLYAYLYGLNLIIYIFRK